MPRHVLPTKGKGVKCWTKSGGYCHATVMPRHVLPTKGKGVKCWTKSGGYCHATVIPRHVLPTKGKGVKHLGKDATSSGKGTKKGPLMWVKSTQVHTCQKDTYKPYTGRKARRDLKNLAMASHMSHVRRYMSNISNSRWQYQRFHTLRQCPCPNT
ncbi:unnamed protein product [Meganyctiphanes norvegica]|uniref:Uncharacterized protein n=1 Tax=Meganyctiphanes norvegica TaxID=48144 RepID=A0AAV2SA58_MEGNR